MLRSLKKELKDLVARTGGEIFRRLKEDVLESESNLYNDLIVIQARYNELKRSGSLGVIRFENKDVTFNSVNEALIWVIDSIQNTDLSPACQRELETKNKNRIPDAETIEACLQDHHIYTCNRQKQTARFKELNKISTEKTHFHYFYGGDRQSHKGLFYRLAYELDNRLMDHINPDYESSCKSVTVDFTCDYYDDLEIYKEEIVKSLFVAFDIPVNEQEPLLQKNLADVFVHSPKVQNLKPQDFVCVLMIVGEYDWDARKTPVVAKWFIEQFCNKGINATSPSFYFFFAIEYDESNDEIKDEIGEALAMAEYIQPLPELNMVSFKDIGRWFGKYRKIEEDGAKRRKMMEEHFEKGSDFYMADVVEILKGIIDQQNNKKYIK